MSSRCWTDVDVSPLAPFGAEVRGIAVDALDAVEAEVVMKIVAQHGIVAFRGQTTGDSGLVRFLGQLGPLTFTAGETPVEGAPTLNVVSNLGRIAPPKSVFHTDTSYVERPPAFTALRPVKLPRAGGATLFSDQVGAADRLPTRLRTRLSGRSVLHSASGVDGETMQTRHPLFRRHPVTGAVALYLSTPERCSALSGVDAETSKRVIAALYRHSIRQSHLYAHHWRDGDILVWDDRTTMHRADHGHVVGDRVLHRGLVLGEVPIAA